jgi:hypothetical protein
MAMFRDPEIFSPQRSAGDPLASIESAAPACRVVRRFRNLKERSWHGFWSQLPHTRRPLICTTRGPDEMAQVFSSGMSHHHCEFPSWTFSRLWHAQAYVECVPAIVSNATRLFQEWKKSGSPDPRGSELPGEDAIIRKEGDKNG